MNYRVKNIHGKINNKSVTVEVPGSKSITARALLIAALAEGESTLINAQFSDDCKTFLKCLNDLGVRTEVCGTIVKVQGCGGKLALDRSETNVGSAGTAARFIPALLAFQRGEFTLNCSEQMKRRPVAPLIDTLRQVGAEFGFSERENSYPFTIRGAAEPAARVSADITESSQFLSAVLISAVCAGRPFGVTAIGEHGLDYVKMTLDMMRAFGASVNNEGAEYLVGGKYSAREYEIEPDISAACYFYAINRILGTDIKVRGVTPRSMQGDLKFINILRNFDGGSLDMREFSDQTLTLAAIAPYFSQPTRICGVGHIRGQECDRIRAIVDNLTAMKVRCEETEDGVIVYPSVPQPAQIDTFGDHRVAMSFAVTGLRADGMVIKDAEVCSKTFAEYFGVMDELCGKLTK